MARVLVATQAWGLLWEKDGNRNVKIPVQGRAASINTTVYAASTGTPTVAFVSNDDGELPGWVEEGDWTLTVNGESFPAPAVAGTTDARLRSLESDSAEHASSIAVIEEAPINVLNPPGALAPAPDDGTTDALPALNAIVAALPSVKGGAIMLGKNHRVNGAWVFDRPVRLIGQGAGIPSTRASSLLTSPAGVNGIELGENARKSHLSDLYLKSEATAAGPGAGITSKASRGILENVTIESFGSDGVLLDTSVSGNANLTKLDAVRSVSNFGHGFHFLGNDSNLVTLIACDAMLNAGWGYRSTTNHNVFLGPHSNGNALGAYYDSGLSCIYLNPYSEGPPAVGDNATLAGTSTVWIGTPWAAPTLTVSGTNVSVQEGNAFGDQTNRVTTLRNYGLTEIYRAAAQLGSTAFRIFNAAETSPRWLILGNGRQQWGDGTAMDVDLMRHAAGVLGVNTAQAFRTGKAATASRPSAATVGQGSQFFDITLNKPIWSDGTAWRDATGAVV